MTRKRSVSIGDEADLEQERFNLELEINSLIKENNRLKKLVRKLVEELSVYNPTNPVVHESVNGY